MPAFDFDTMADRTLDHARKWDRSIIQSKFPGTPDDFIPMWIADMDFPAAPAIREALVQVAANGAYGYTWAHSGFFDAVINWQARRHANHVERDWITLCYGTVPTMHYLYQTFCQPNDAIIVNTPVYDPFGYAARHNGVRVVSNKLIYRDRRYFIDFEALERQLAEEHPRVMLFCSPHNPAGRIWTLDEITRVAASVMGKGRVIPRFAIFTTAGETPFSFSTKDNHATLRAMREHLGEEALVRSPSFVEVFGAGVRRIFRGKSEG